MKPNIDALIVELDRFRSLRNFFAHFDERISDLNKHGITGAQNTNCGISYTANATGCFHIVLVGNVIHFSSNGTAEEIDVGKDSFLQVLQASRSIYDEITSHNIHKCDYPASGLVYA